MCIARRLLTRVSVSDCRKLRRNAKGHDMEGTGIPKDLQEYAAKFGGRVVFCTAPTFPPEAPATAPDGPTVAEAKRQLEQAAQSLTGDMRATWEGMGTTDHNEMVIEVQRGKDAAEVVRAWCVIE